MNRIKTIILNTEKKKKFYKKTYINKLNKRNFLKEQILKNNLKC